MDQHKEMLKEKRRTSMALLMITPATVVWNLVPTTHKMVINMVYKVP